MPNENKLGNPIRTFSAASRWWILPRSPTHWFLELCCVHVTSQFYDARTKKVVKPRLLAVMFDCYTTSVQEDQNNHQPIHKLALYESPDFHSKSLFIVELMLLRMPLMTIGQINRMIKVVVKFKVFVIRLVQNFGIRWFKVIFVSRVVQKSF